MNPDRLAEGRAAIPADTKSGPQGGVPALLAPQRGEAYFDGYFREYQPVGPTELAIVSDMARQAAAMERWGAAAEAVERQAAQMLPPVEGLAASNDCEDVLLAAAMGTDTADRCERHALGHSRAFYRALQHLEATQSRRKKRATVRPTEPPGFASEADCIEYLADRFRRGQTPCPRCGGTTGYFLAERKTWECGRCQTQTGLRAGTLMAHSPLPLKDWFLAIGWILIDPTISTRKLIEKLPITRRATIAKMAKKIRKALCAENASALLAGLDQRNHPPAEIS